VVMNNETLMIIARAAPSDLETLRALNVLGPWKLEEYGPDLLSVVAEGPQGKR
jgi:DNA helicase II / ATP-dependent DNA helicase PcrA